MTDRTAMLGDWRDDGSCRGHDHPALWTGDDAGNHPEAYRICRGCPVRRDCLQAALELSAWDDFGVWGGTSQHSRHLMRRGQIDVEEALGRGDRQAAMRTHVEQLADDEPWLLTEVDV